MEWVGRAVTEAWRKEVTTSIEGSGIKIMREAKNLGMDLENVGITVRGAGTLKGWRDLTVKAWERGEETEARGGSVLGRKLGS